MILEHQVKYPGVGLDGCHQVAAPRVRVDHLQQGACEGEIALLRDGDMGACVNHQVQRHGLPGADCDVARQEVGKSVIQRHAWGCALPLR